MGKYVAIVAGMAAEYLKVKLFNSTSTIVVIFWHFSFLDALRF